MNWKNIARFLAAIGVALGGHYVAPDAKAEAVAAVIAVALAQRNRALVATDPDEPARLY